MKVEATVSPDWLNVAGGGQGREEKESFKDASEVLAQVTESIESPSAEIAKAAVRRVAGGKVSSVLEIRFEESRPPGGDIIESAVGLISLDLGIKVCSWKPLACYQQDV